MERNGGGNGGVLWYFDDNVDVVLGIMTIKFGSDEQGSEGNK